MVKILWHRRETMQQGVHRMDTGMIFLKNTGKGKCDDFYRDATAACRATCTCNPIPEKEEN